MSKENEEAIKTALSALPDFKHLASANEIAAATSRLLLPKLPAIDFGLAPAIRLGQELAKNRLSFNAPLIGTAFEEIQKSWQMPLAMKAFSASLGLNESLFKLPKWDFPKIDFNALHERDERAARHAAQHNWFIQPETFYDFAEDINECGEDTSRLDQLFVQMTNSLKTEILDCLIREHPKHAPLIEEAFRLHDEKRYLAAIPLAMIAAEGIAYSVSEKSIFNTAKNRPEIAGWLDKQDLSKLAKAFLGSLSEQHPMSKPRPGKLNRHHVLHGWNTSYGSELFSLQAISLLGFIGWAFAMDGLVNDSADTTSIASENAQ